MKVESGYTEMLDCFERAAETSSELLEACFTLAGQLVKVRIVGRELAEQVMRPFVHLPSEPGPKPPKLSIDLWDQRATGIRTKTVPSPGQQNPHPASDDGRFTLHFHRQSILGLDRIGNRIVGCCTAADELSLYERGRPLHAPLTLWLTDRDIPVIHAGLVASAGRGVLLAGSGGSGKSTTAITSLAHGFTFLSDDLIGLEMMADVSFRGHSIYNSTYLESGHLERFPQLKPLALKSRYSVEDKQLVLLSNYLPSGIGHSADIRVIVLPRLGPGRRTTYRSASRANTLMALGPSSRKINRDLGVRGFDKLVKVVERFPTYWLELGTDLDDIPRAMMDLLDEVDERDTEVTPA